MVMILLNKTIGREWDEKRYGNWGNRVREGESSEANLQRHEKSPYEYDVQLFPPILATGRWQRGLCESILCHSIFQQGWLL